MRFVEEHDQLLPQGATRPTHEEVVREHRGVVLSKVCQRRIDYRDVRNVTQAVKDTVVRTEMLLRHGILQQR